VLIALSIGIGLTAPLLPLEAVLRVLPVRSGLHSLPVNERDPVRHFLPNRDFTFSQGWDFKHVNRGRTNNFGFVNQQDYDSTAQTPLLAVIGDSYVAALMVPYPETMHGRLAQCVEGRGRIYSFGISGAPLSQYLVEASLARSKFRPQGFVVLIVGNDFDESLREYNKAPGWHYFRADSGRLFLDRADYSPDPIREVLRHSALVRYIDLHLSSSAFRARNVFKRRARNDRRYVGNTDASFTPERLEASYQAIEEFLVALPSHAGVGPDSILLMVDGMRPNLYSDSGLSAANGSFFDLMRSRLLERGKALGYELADMQPRFLQRHKLDGSRFEFGSDLHWDSRGYEEATRAVAGSRVFRQVFPAASPPARHLAVTPMPPASDSAGLPSRPCGSLGFPPRKHSSEGAQTLRSFPPPVPNRSRSTRHVANHGR
jgi:hypothetical protein